MAEHLMPDCLPSRYRSWLDIYLEVRDKLNNSGHPFDEATTIKLSELERADPSEGSKEVQYFTHEWPLSIIKARALDDMLAMLPDRMDMMNFLIRSRYYATSRPAGYDPKFDETWTQLMTYARHLQPRL